MTGPTRQGKEVVVTELLFVLSTCSPSPLLQTMDVVLPLCAEATPSFHFSLIQLDDDMLYNIRCFQRKTIGGCKRSTGQLSFLDSEEGRPSYCCQLLCKCIGAVSNPLFGLVIVFWVFFFFLPSIYFLCFTDLRSTLPLSTAPQSVAQKPGQRG